MPIEVTCTCGKKLRARDDLAGKKAKCPSCGAVMNIPAAEPAVAPAADPMEALAAAAAPPAPVPAAPTNWQQRAAFKIDRGNACPHCGADNEQYAAYCEACGKALPLATDTGPRIVSDKDFAATDAGQELQGAELEKRAKSASNTLIVIGVLVLGLDVLVLSIVGSAHRHLSNSGLGIVAAIGILGLIYIGLGIWARYNPLPAAIVGLSLYTTTTVIYFVRLVEGMQSNPVGPTDTAPACTDFIVPLAIIFFLARAVDAGLKHRRLLKMQAERREPGAIV